MQLIFRFDRVGRANRAWDHDATAQPLVGEGRWRGAFPFSGRAGELLSDGSVAEHVRRGLIRWRAPFDLQAVAALLRCGAGGVGGGHRTGEREALVGFANHVFGCRCRFDRQSFTHPLEGIGRGRRARPRPALAFEFFADFRRARYFGRRGVDGLFARAPGDFDRVPAFFFFASLAVFPQHDARERVALVRVGEAVHGSRRKRRAVPQPCIRELDAGAFPAAGGAHEAPAGSQFDFRWFDVVGGFGRRNRGTGGEQHQQAANGGQQNRYTPACTGAGPG